MDRLLRLSSMAQNSKPGAMPKQLAVIMSELEGVKVSNEDIKSMRYCHRYHLQADRRTQAVELDIL